jgi:hypothetical protein
MVEKVFTAWTEGLYGKEWPISFLFRCEDSERYRDLLYFEARRFIDGLGISGKRGVRFQAIEKRGIIPPILAMASSSQSATNHDMYTEEERHAIEAQLERLLANPYFSHSRRFPSFLRYIVNATVNGHADLLKERTLGIEIFAKSAAYDPALDPIVRVTAAEIRKRIAQYYQDPGHENELKVSLPPGSYVPQFQFSGVGYGVANAGPNDPALMPAESAVALTQTRAAHRTRWIVAAFAALALLSTAAWFVTWRISQHSAFAEFWDPILNSQEPVLFCVADQTQYTTISQRDAENPAQLVTLKDNLTAVVIDDLSTIVKIAGVLQSKGIHYSLRGESATNLMDLRNGSSVIVGAFDNAWTLRLTKTLRYRFANDPDMAHLWIVDSMDPKQPRWIVDRGEQMATNNYQDYAIVARFTDDLTGKPTLIAAGIARGGTIAAGEFLTNPELLRVVRSHQSSPNAKNVELVLSTQIVDGDPGTPKIEAVYYW